MENKKIKNKYRILVLIDLLPRSEKTLIDAVNLAQIIHGNIEVFYVKPLTDIIDHENQMSAMRAMEEERLATKKKLQDLIDPVAKNEGISIDIDFTFGNVKNEIEKHLKKTNPDIVVLGKRKRKLINLLGDNVTQFILNTFSGIILMGGEAKKLQLNDEISIGLFNDAVAGCNIEIIQDLSKRTMARIKLFGLRKKSDTLVKNVMATRLKTIHNIEEIIEYEFEEGSHGLDGLANYVTKNNVGLLCIGRGERKKGWTDRYIGGAPSVNKAIQKLNIPLLIWEDN